MRDLTKQQKKFLMGWANSNPDKMKGWQPVDNMSGDDWDKLTEMNDTEILYQNCNRFLNDLGMRINPITQKIMYVAE